VFFLSSMVRPAVALPRVGRKVEGVNKRTVPPQWQKVFDDAQVRFSFNGLQEKTGLGINTVIRFLTGEGEAEDDTAERIAKTLAIPVVDALALRGDDVTGLFAMPLKARRLDATERQVVLDVVNTILRAKEVSHAEATNQTAAAGTPVEAGQTEEVSGRPATLQNGEEWSGGWGPGGDEDAGVRGDEDGEQRNQL
jgi:hypothetical protein